MRPSAFVLSAWLALSLGGTAHASGVLADTTAAQPAAVDVQAAVAATPFGSTRWSRITVAGHARVMWLVPARPGAAVDWAADAWLDALDDASAPRVVPPTAPPPSCALPRSGSADRVGLWGKVGTKEAPGAIAVATSEAALRERVGQRGFALPRELDARVTSLYARGWVLLSIELDASGPVTSSPTLRVSDDGGPALPLALTGGSFGDTRLTVFTITSGATTIAGAAEIDPATLAWGADGSDYADRRRAFLERHPWLRESSTHEALFAGASLPMQPGVAPAMRTYFDKASAHGSLACVNAARAAATSQGIVNRACAPGAVAHVPGGTACAPSSGGIDAAAFACGGADDLALALAGHAPQAAFLTRFAGRVPRGSLGEDTELASSASPRSTVIAAGAWERCPPPPDDSTLGPPRSTAPPFTGGGEASWNGPAATSSEGCGGGGAYYADSSYEDSSESCSSSTGSSDSWDDGDDSGGWWDDDDSDDEYDEYDDSDGDDDSDDDSYEESDSDDESETSTWSGESSTASMKTACATNPAKVGAKTKKRVEKRRASPVSRMALLLGALVLPLRRRRRDTALDDGSFV